MCEYATVEEVNSDYIVVKTTKDERYKIERRYISELERSSNIKLDTLLFVIYEPDNKVENGDHFDVRPTRIEKGISEIEKPA